MRPLTKEEQEKVRILDATESKPDPKLLSILQQVLMFRALLVFFIPEDQRGTIWEKDPKEKDSKEKDSQEPEVVPTTAKVPEKKRGKVYLARKLRKRRAKGKARQVDGGDGMRKIADSISRSHPLRNMVTAADLGLDDDE